MAPAMSMPAHVLPIAIPASHARDAVASSAPQAACYGAIIYVQLTLIFRFLIEFLDNTVIGGGGTFRDRDIGCPHAMDRRIAPNPIDCARRELVAEQSCVRGHDEAFARSGLRARLGDCERDRQPAGLPVALALAGEGNL